MPNTDEALKKFGIALRNRRKTVGMTQRKLAKCAGISSKSICNIEMGNNWPSVPVLIAMSRILHPGKKIPFIE
jgi:DNA-binding XRE family transcriptional regulator